MSADELVFQHFTVCSERFLNEKLLELPEYGWQAERLQAMKVAWEQVKGMGAEAVTIEAGALQDAIRTGIIECHSCRWWYAPFEGHCNISSPFSPPPGVPTLYSRSDSRNRETHYLWGSREFKEIVLQLWLYCDQDVARFKGAIAVVWHEYSHYSRSECGHAGESGKFAAALRRAADPHGG